LVPLVRLKRRRWRRMPVPGQQLTIAKRISPHASVQRCFPGIFTDRVIHYANLFPLGKLADACGDILFFLFHAAAGGVGLIACQWAKALGAHLIGTVGSAENILRQRRLFSRTNGTNQVRAQRFCPLAGNQPDTAGGWRRMPVPGQQLTIAKRISPHASASLPRGKRLA
jgi:hypothetical protein